MKFKPILVALVLILIFYWPFFHRHLIPAPLDIITGMYLPWMDHQYPNLPNGVPFKNPLPSDVVSLTMPFRFQVVEMYKSKIWPLWNPQILSGTPLLGNFQSAALNPLNLLYFLPFKFIDIWSIQVILQPFLAFIFFYLFISLYIKDFFAKIFGGLFWSFSGFFSLWFQYNTLVYAAIFLPLGLYAVNKMSQNFRWGFLLSLSLCFSVLSGNPPVTLVVFGTTVLYSLFIYHERWQKFLLSLLFVGLSFFYSAPQLLPCFISSANSVRRTDNVATEANIKFLPYHRLITFVVPDYFGHPSTQNTWQKETLYDNTTLYFGILPLLVLLISLRIKWVKEQKQIYLFSIFLILLSFLIILPNPLSKAFSQISFLGLSSMVFTRLSFLIAFSFSIIVSLYFDHLKNNKINYHPLIFSATIIFFSITIPFVVSLILNRYFSQIPLIDWFWPLQTKTAYRNCFYPFLIFSSTTIFLFLHQRLDSKFLKQLLLVFVFGVSLFDLYRFFSKYNSFSSPEYFYPASSSISFLQNNSFRFIRESSQVIPSNTWSVYPNLQTPSGYDTTYSLRYGQFISLLNGSKLDSSPNRYLEIDNFSSPLLNLLSVDHIIATKKDKDYRLSTIGKSTSALSPPRYFGVADYGVFQIFKNTQVLPFIRPIEKLVFSPRLEVTQNLLKQSNIDKVAIVENQSLQNIPLTTDIQITNSNISPQKITFETISRANQSSFVVISQNFDPGWQLNIDQKSSTIHVANHTFTGLLIPSGNHHIELFYWPQNFSLAIAMSILSLITSLIFIFYRSTNA